MSVGTTHAPSTAAEQFAQRRHSPVQRIQHLLHAHPALSPLMVLIVSCIAFTIINPRFASPATISVLLQQTAVIAALAIGQTLVILTAGIDLAVGAISIVSMLLMANLSVNNGVPGVLAILIGIVFGTACGFLNGVLVTRLGYHRSSSRLARSASSPPSVCSTPAEPVSAKRKCRTSEM